MNTYVKTTPVGAIPCKGSPSLVNDYPTDDVRMRVCAWVLKHRRRELTGVEELAAERYLAGSQAEMVRATVDTLCTQYDHLAS